MNAPENSIFEEQQTKSILVVEDDGPLRFILAEWLRFNNYNVIEATKADDAVIGARVMGGGFGGCTINLVKKGNENEVKRKFSKLYLDTFGIELKFYDVKVSNGTTLL